jgi:hypothetical protein
LAGMAAEAGLAAAQLAEAPPAPVAVGVTLTPVAEAPPDGAVFRTLAVSVTAWPALTVAGGWARKVTARPAAAWTVDAEVVAVAVSTAAELASVPLAAAVKLTLPVPEGVQVKVKATVELAGMAAEAGLAAAQLAEAPPAPVAVGATVTPVAEAPPAGAVFRRLAVRVMAWPALTVAGGWARKVAARPAAAWTVVAGAVVAAAASAAPEFTSAPFAVAVKVVVPAPDGVQVKVNATVELAVMTEEAGLAAVQLAEAPPAPVAVGVTTTLVAEAPPAATLFRTLAMSVTTWPALIVTGGWAWKVTARPAGAWTVVAGAVVAVAVRAVPEPAAVPFAVAVKARVPVPDGVHVKV